MTAATPTVWTRLRSSRASPPGRASPAASARRRTYNAALEQFEQLIDAARRVGVSSRPLPLFYALSQAGRAVAAAQGDEPWQLRGHGLQLKGEHAPLLERTIAPDDRPTSSFRRISEIVGSDVLREPASLGALCASLPDLANETALVGEHPRALFVRAIQQSSGAFITLSPDVQSYVFNLPESAITASSPAEAIAQHLSHYPTSAGWALVDPLRHFPPHDGWGAGTLLQW